MPIAHTISSDAEMRKGFANTISKRIPFLRDFCKSTNCCIAMRKIACGLDGMDWRDISSLIEQTFKNSGITIYFYTSKDDIGKLQKVETNTLEQKEVLEIIECELIEKCTDERELATDCSIEAKKLCRPHVNDQFPKSRDKLQSNRIINKAVSDFVFKYKIEMQFKTSSIWKVSWIILISQ